MIVFIILILLILLYIFNSPETFLPSTDDPRDTLNIPSLPETINEYEINNYFRLINITKHLVLDDDNRTIYLLTYKPSNCYQIRCPPWTSNVVCWKC